MADIKMYGIDISHWNNDAGKINWTKVKASGNDFAIIKAGGWERNKYADPRFEVNYWGAVNAGLHVGAYYFTGSQFLGAKKGVSDAEHFIMLLGDKRFDMPVYVDIEACPKHRIAEATAAAAAFCRTMESAGFFAGIYSADVAGFVERLNPVALEPFTKWVARWSPSPPQHSGSYAMWQYSNKGSVPGISGRVDLNYCYQDFPSIIKRVHRNGY